MRKETLGSILLIIVCLFAMNGTKTSGCAPSFYWIYSDEIEPGDTFRWQIEKLEAEGEMFDFTDNFFIGQQLLHQGDKVNLEVIDEPDTGTSYSMDTSFFKLSVNGLYVEKKRINFDSEFGDYMSEEFIIPIGEGEFNDYRNTFDELLDGQTTQDITLDGYQTTYTFWYKVFTDELLWTVSRSIQNGIYTQEMYYYDYYNEIGSEDEEIEYEEIVVRTTRDISSGVLLENEMSIDYSYLDVEDNETLIDDTGSFHFLMTNINTVSFNIFGLIPLFFVGVILVRIKKKK